jgi:ubiquinone/menaquinone biosynthesis C-methylase UbiE
MEEKFILELSNKEILTEMYSIIGKEKLPGRETIGYITTDGSEYFNNGIIDESKLKSIYNRNDKLMKKYIITLSITSLRNRKKDLFKLIRNQKEGNAILDYGCGVSTHAIACAQLGCLVHILDISDIMLNVSAKRFERRNLNYIAHRKEITIPHHYFNTIICTDVIEHVPRPDKMLLRFMKYLKRDGIAHLHISPHVNYERGHLKQAIDIWNKDCQIILEKHFKKLSENNYQLVKK